MKRTQIYIESEVDRQITSLAKQRGVSKAQLIRQSIDGLIAASVPVESDPLMEVAGSMNFTPVEPDKIDEIIYKP